ncbi:hypothetical protein DMENIID0001_091030 [Sergentomyia squamirostris]
MCNIVPTALLQTLKLKKAKRHSFLFRNIIRECFMVTTNPSAKEAIAKMMNTRKTRNAKTCYNVNGHLKAMFYPVSPMNPLQMKKINEISLKQDEALRYLRQMVKGEQTTTPKRIIDLEFKFPLKHKEQLESLNQQLKDLDYRKDFVDAFSVIGGKGKTGNQESGDKFAYKLIDRLCDRKIFLSFTWSGVSNKGQIDRFNVYTDFIDTFAEIVRLQDERYTDVENHAFFRDRIMKHRHTREIEEQVNVKIETENLNCKFLLNNFVLSINRQPGNDLESFKVSAILHFVNDNFERHSIWLFSKQFHNEDADAIRTAIQSDIKKCFPQADKIWSKLISVSNVGVEKILPKTLPCILQQLNSVQEQSLDIKDDVDYYRFYNTIESVKKLMECTRLRSTGKNLMDRLELDETNQARYTVAVLKAFMEHKEDLEIRQADKDTDLEFIKNIDTNTVQYILELVKLFKDAAETLYYEQFNKPTSHLVFGVISSLIKNLEDIQISTVRVMMYMEHFGLRSRLTKGLKKIFKSLDGIYLAAHYLNPITSQSDKCLRFSDEQFQDKDMFIYENYEEIKEHFDIKKKPKYPLPRWVRNRDMEDVYDVSGRNREEECYEKARIAADTDILEFWKNHKGSEILRIIALQVLSVPAATACSGKSIFAWS